MVFRRFRKQFEHVGPIGKQTFPRNWGGEVSDDIASAADKAGATLPGEAVPDLGIFADGSVLADEALLEVLDRRGLAKSIEAVTDDDLVSEVARRELQQVAPSIGDLRDGDLLDELSRRKITPEVPALADVGDDVLLEEIQRRELTPAGPQIGDLDDKVLLDELVKRGVIEPAKSLDDMTKDELIAEAALRKVEIKPSDNKPEILAALKAAEQPIA